MPTSELSVFIQAEFVSVGKKGSQDNIVTRRAPSRMQLQSTVIAQASKARIF